MPADAPRISQPTLQIEPVLTVDQDSAIVAANAAACRMLGATEEMLVGAPFLARVAGEERRAAELLLEDGLRGAARESSLLLQCEHTEVRRVQVRTTPVKVDDEVPCLLLTLGTTPVERTIPRSEVGTFREVVRSAHGGAHAPRPDARRRPPAGQHPTVLVIDDDEALRAVIRRSLEMGGFTVIEATSGRHALTQLGEGHPVDLVVTDLKMEDGSGGWLLAQLAYEHPELVGRTVVMAGDTEDVGAAHVASRWRCPVLGKPFSSDVLIDTLTALAHGR